jgi:hypothetical protein
VEAASEATAVAAAREVAVAQPVSPAAQSPPVRIPKARVPKSQARIAPVQVTQAVTALVPPAEQATVERAVLDARVEASPAPAARPASAPAVTQPASLPARPADALPRRARDAVVSAPG